VEESGSVRGESAGGVNSESAPRTAGDNDDATDDDRAISEEGVV